MKQRVLSAMRVVNKSLAFDTFGNVSQRSDNSFIIKPTGLNMEEANPVDMSVVDLESGKTLEGAKPSTDTPTHLVLYRSFGEIGGIAHTHSTHATAWAQAAKSIPCLGTTHADYWKVDVPVTRMLTDEEIYGDYEQETGQVILETLHQIGVGPLECPGILVAHHGPFTWGKTVEDAVKNAERLEYIAKLASNTLRLTPNAPSIPAALHSRHFNRKHGPKSYYGQDYYEELS